MVGCFQGHDCSSSQECEHGLACRSSVCVEKLCYSKIDCEDGEVCAAGSLIGMSPMFMYCVGACDESMPCALPEVCRDGICQKPVTQTDAMDDTLDFDTNVPPEDVPGEDTNIPPEDGPGEDTNVPPEDIPGEDTNVPPEDVPLVDLPVEDIPVEDVPIADVHEETEMPWMCTLDDDCMDWFEEDDIAMCNRAACDTESGACVNTPYSCDDGIPCTIDSCDGLGGCNREQTPGQCLIDNLCYANGAPNPDNMCELCDLAISAFEWSESNARVCDDFNYCTINDICSGGLCAGTRYDCSDAIECTLDLCDGMGGCSNPLSPDACRIGGICYKKGDERPGIPCEACVPATSQSNWTKLNTGAVEICNGIDDNCDGVTDPVNSVGCTTYLRDLDEDGYGLTDNLRCLCAPAAPYTATVASDCCDSDNRVKPVGALPHTTLNNCNSWDYNCDGTISKQYNYGDGSCGGLMYCKQDMVEGWRGAAPGCGQVGIYLENCTLEFIPPVCQETTKNLTQGCF